jgi:hypothetical protein
MQLLGILIVLGVTIYSVVSAIEHFGVTAVSIFFIVIFAAIMFVIWWLCNRNTKCDKCQRSFSRLDAFKNRLVLRKEIILCVDCSKSMPFKIEDLQQAITDRKRISFDYSVYTEKHWELDPYIIEGGRIHGWVDQTNEQRTFSVAKMENLDILNDKFGFKYERLKEIQDDISCFNRTMSRRTPVKKEVSTMTEPQFCPKCGKSYDLSWSQCLVCKIPLKDKNESIPDTIQENKILNEQKILEKQEPQVDLNHIELQKTLDSLGIKYSPTLSAPELKKLKHIALYVDFVNKATNEVDLNPEKRNSIVWGILSNAWLHGTIENYKSHRWGTIGFYEVSRVINTYLKVPE